MKNTIKKTWNLIVLFYNNMLLIEKFMIVLMMFVRATDINNQYPSILMVFMLWMIVDSVIKRIKLNNKK